eukprot:5841446-Amphidinium_carterae.1
MLRPACNRELSLLSSIEALLPQIDTDSSQCQTDGYSSNNYGWLLLRLAAHFCDGTQCNVLSV